MVYCTALIDCTGEWAMRAIRCRAEVNGQGQIVVEDSALGKGTAVEVIVLVPGPGEDEAPLLAASQSSLDFWDNPVDDQAWNHA